MEQKERGPDDDTYARESFTFRRMTRGQVWALTTIVVVVLAGVVVYAIA